MERRIGMIKQFEEYTWKGESDKVKTFVPFEIRDQIDPNFEISDVEDYSDIKLDLNQDYLKIIRQKVVGKVVEFYSYNYIRKTSTKEKWNVVNVIFNAYGILVFTGYLSKFGKATVAVDERKIIKYREIKRLTTDDDPYGEEDWD